MLRFFQMCLSTGFVMLVACGPKDLSEHPVDAAPDINELAVWAEPETVLPEAPPSVWDITKRHNSFSTFSLLIEVAGLEETLKSSPQITVLAPTEEAFQLLGEGSLIELLKEDNRWILEELLLNHLIPDVHLSEDLRDGETRPTLSGRRLQISRDAHLKLSNATITTSDIAASNGVVHVIDQVILPE